MKESIITDGMERHNAVPVGPLEVNFREMTANFPDEPPEPLTLRQLQVLVILDGGVVSIHDILDRLQISDASLCAAMEEMNEGPLMTEAEDTESRAMVRAYQRHVIKYGNRIPHPQGGSVKTVISGLNEMFGPIIVTQWGRGYSLDGSPVWLRRE